MQLRIENKLHPIVKNKLLDLTHLPAQPYLRQYNENDLLTEIERPNPDWHEGDPEDERYIIEYVDEGYTGFLPVNLQVENPNFVQLWGKEDSEGEISFGSLPITENGKYKFWFNYEGFANGYIPVKRYDNNTNDYDYNINVSVNPKIQLSRYIRFYNESNNNYSGYVSLNKITTAGNLQIYATQEVVWVKQNQAFYYMGNCNSSASQPVQVGDWYYKGDQLGSQGGFTQVVFYKYNETNQPTEVVFKLRDLNDGTVWSTVWLYFDIEIL